MPLIVIRRSTHLSFDGAIGAAIAKRDGMALLDRLVSSSTCMSLGSRLAVTKQEIGVEAQSGDGADIASDGREVQAW